jgi:hypothetical protein
LAITEHRQLNILILSPLAAVACPFLPPCRSAARKFNQSAVHIGCKRQALLIPENEAAGLLAAVERFDPMASVSKAAIQRLIATPPPPRSPDRTQSPVAVSQKREYFKYPPETIGDFAPAAANLGARRPIANSQKPAIGGHF